MEQIRRFENDFMKLEMREGIVIGWYKDRQITLELAKQAVEHRLEFAKHIPVSMIAAEQGVRGFTREARQFLSSEQGLQGLIAGAIVTKTAFASHIANFFIRISLVKSKIPMRTFNSIEDAISWLKTQNHELGATA